MKRLSWLYCVLAAAIVALGGVALVAAETMKVKVEQRDGEELSIDVNGEVRSYRVEDFEVGEEKTFEAGERSIVVRRVDDALQVSLDGGSHFGLPGQGAHEMEKMVWVTAGGNCEGCEGCDHGTPSRVVVMKGEGAGEGPATAYAYRIGSGEGEHMGEQHIEIDIEKIEELVAAGELEALESLEGDPKVMVWRSEGDEGHPIVVKTHHARGDFVRYRCEETGSELRVKKDKAVYDSYTDPATGCVMERVEEAEVKVITMVHTKVEAEDDAAD